MCHSATWFLFCVILFWPNSCVIEIWPHWYKNVWLIPSPCSVLVWIKWAFSQCLALANPAWGTPSEPLTQWGLLSLCALGWVPHCTSAAPSPVPPRTPVNIPSCLQNTQNQTVYVISSFWVEHHDSELNFITLPTRVQIQAVPPQAGCWTFLRPSVRQRCSQASV